MRAGSQLSPRIVYVSLFAIALIAALAVYQPIYSRMTINESFVTKLNANGQNGSDTARSIAVSSIGNANGRRPGALPAPFQNRAVNRVGQASTSNSATNTPAWTLRVTNPNGTPSTSPAQALAAPVLIAPVNGATVIENASTQFSWNTVAGATGYDLQFNAEPIINRGSSTSFTLISNTLGGHTWKARAKNASGAGPWSTARSFTIVSNTPTVAPTLIAPANGATVIANAATQFSWNSVAGATGYDLQFNSEPIIDRGSSTSFTLISNTLATHTWRVRAKTATGAGPWSTTRSFTIVSNVPTVAPTLIAPVNGATVIENASTQFSWNTVAGATGYDLQFNAEPIINRGSSTSFTLISNTLGGHTWKARAKNASGAGPWSTARSFTIVSETPPVPVLNLPPDLTSYPAGTTSVNLIWNPVSGATYDIQVGTSCGGTSIANWNQSAARSLVPGLSNGRTYYWRVRSINSGAPSAYSSCRSFSVNNVVGPVPSVPVLSSPLDEAIFDAGTTSVNLFWNPVTGSTYHLQVGTSCGETSIADWDQTASSSWVPRLSNGRTYYWRVRSINSGAPSAYSSCRSFRVNNNAPNSVQVHHQSQGDPPWAGLHFGKQDCRNKYDLPCTFQSSACVVTAFSMALNYVVEKDFGDNSHPFTPLALNKTFLDVNGYDNESGVDGKILEEVEYPVTSGNKPFSWVPLTETTSVNDLSAALANRYPVTVRVKFHSTDTVYGHTVLVTDQEVATGGMPRFKIHDPGLRTNLYLDTAYQNNFIIKGYVKSESQNLSGLQRSATVNSDELAFLSVSSGESIQLMVIDPLGRRTGFDPSTQQRVNEIPNSSYNDELNINPFTLDPLDSAPLVRTVSVYDPLPGTYQIVSFGVTTGAFKLDFKIISRTGQLRRSLIAGSIQAGATVNSSFDYVDDPSPTPTPTPTPTGTPTPTPTPTPTTGTYANASIALSGSTTVTHDGPVTNASYATATTTANFKGRLEVDPTTGTVRVTNAHPAGDYLVTVTVYYSLGAMATKTFTLTVTTPVACNTFGPTAFAATTNSGVGSGVYSVVVGDFNGDGKQDLVTANQEGNSVSVLLRNAANTGFDPKADFPVGGGPDAVAVGDLNGDGRQDIVAANTGGNNVSVLLRNAANTGFDAQVTFLVGNSPLSVAVGELNGDRKQDIVTANANGNSVSVLQRNAANTGFDPKLDFAVGGYPDSVAVGDFNGDGKQDIVTANGTANSVSVLLRNTANTGFDAQAQFAVGTDPTSVAVGDFNGDGKQDIVAANVNSSSVSVLQRNSANTSFDPKVDFAVGNLAQSVAVGDFNGDGKQDIVAGNFGPNIVSVLLRNAANTSFDPTVNFAIDAFGILFSVAVGDFNGDHRQDVVAAINGANIVSVLQGNCNAAPTPTPTPTPTPNPTPIPTPTATPLQLLLDQSGPASDQVAALDSILFLRDPFPVVNGANLLNLGVDRNTKISVLVMNLQLTQGESSSSVLVNLIDSNNQSYDVAAEDVRLVPTFNFTQVIFRLPNNLPAGTCTIKIKAHGQISNAGTIRIRI